MNRVFILEKQDVLNSCWEIQGVYLDYKLAQSNFIYKDGVFRITEHEVRKR